MYRDRAWWCVVTLVVFGLDSVSTDSIHAPLSKSPFIGSWNGTIVTSVIGTGDHMFANIQAGEEPGSLMIEHFWSNNSDKIRGSYQLFYLDPTVGAPFSYCGQLHNFETPKRIGWIQAEFRTSSYEEDKWVFCAKTQSGGCKMFKATWTVAGDTLEFEILLPPPVVHAHFIAKRVPTIDIVDSIPSALEDRHKCWGYAARTDSGGRYPWVTQKYPPPPDPQPVFPKKPATEYNCVMYNHKPFSVKLEWKLDATATNIWLQMTAQTAGYVAFGVNPEWPGMLGARIVWGWVNKTGGGCISAAQADQYVGTPTPTNTVHLTNTSVSTNGGLTSISWTMTTKELFAGQGTDMSLLMWAVGDKPMDSCGDIPAYHAGRRGVYLISFTHPEITVPHYMRC